MDKWTGHGQHIFRKWGSISECTCGGTRPSFHASIHHLSALSDNTRACRRLMRTGKSSNAAQTREEKKIRKYYESYRNSERLLLNRCKCPDHYKRLLSNINHNGFGISANGRWSQCTSSVCLRRTLTKFVDRRYRYCSAHTHFSSSSSHCLRMPHVSAHYQQTFIFRYAKQTGQPASYIRRKKNLHGNIIQVLLPVGDWHLHAPPLVRRQFCIFSLFVVLCVPTTRQFRYC